MPRSSSEPKMIVKAVERRLTGCITGRKADTHHEDDYNGVSNLQSFAKFHVSVSFLNDEDT